MPADFKDLDIDEIIRKLLEVRGSRPGKNVALTENEIYALCHKSRDIFIRQPMLLELEAPLKIGGDIHGQYYDLLRLFEYGGFPPENNYLFLGDYVDRGKQSIETICLMMSYKIKYPENFFLLRGNHETASISRIYGFYDECKRRYNIKVWKTFMDCFNCLPVAAIIEEKIFCCHGGLSPDLNIMDDIRNIHRPTDIPDQGVLCDLLWSDPEKDINEDWVPSDRGVSWTFSANVVTDFLKRHEMDLICRGHQVVEDGYEFFANRQLVTIFSAPNYCGEFKNAGAMMTVDETLMCSFQILKPANLFKTIGRKSELNPQNNEQQPRRIGIQEISSKLSKQKMPTVEETPPERNDDKVKLNPPSLSSQNMQNETPTKGMEIQENSSELSDKKMTKGEETPPARNDIKVESNSPSISSQNKTMKIQENSSELYNKKMPTGEETRPEKNEDDKVELNPPSLSSQNTRNETPTKGMKIQKNSSELYKQKMPTGGETPDFEKNDGKVESNSPSISSQNKTMEIQKNSSELSNKKMPTGEETPPEKNDDDKVELNPPSLLSQNTTQNETPTKGMKIQKKSRESYKQKMPTSGETSPEKNDDDKVESNPPSITSKNTQNKISMEEPQSNNEQITKEDTQNK